MSQLLVQNIQLPNPDVSKGPITFEGLSNFKFNNLGDIISSAIPFVISFAGIGLLLMLLVGGFALLTSGGDAKKLEQGKQTLTFALLGFLIIFLAYWVVQIFAAIFGLSETTGAFK